MNDFIATSLPEEKHWAWYTQAVIPLPILRMALNKLWKPNWTIYLCPRTFEKCSRAFFAYGLMRPSIGLQFFIQIRIPWASPTFPWATAGFLMISNWWLYSQRNAEIAFCLLGHISTTYSWWICNRTGNTYFLSVKELADYFFTKTRHLAYKGCLRISLSSS